MPSTSSYRLTAPALDSRRSTSATLNCITANHYPITPHQLTLTLIKLSHFVRRLAKQRYSDTSCDIRPKLHDEKHRSESLPSPEHSLRPYHYTGAISKLKIIDPKDASSQDSGINLSFHEDERKKYRNSLER
jgi:hypothetical protein